MSFSDIETANERNQKTESLYKDIYAGEVRAGNDILFFERINLFQDKFSVMLPTSYVDMPKPLARLKYPMENRPSIIKSNDDTTINFAFNYYMQEFLEVQIESAVNQLKAGLSRMSPGARFSETKILQTKAGVKMGLFDFVTPALDTELYQLFGFVPVHEKFLHVIFNAPSHLMHTWQPIATQVVQSIIDIDENDILS